MQSMTRRQTSQDKIFSLEVEEEEEEQCRYSRLQIVVSLFTRLNLASFLEED